MAETMYLNMRKENDLIDLIIKEKLHRKSKVKKKVVKLNYLIFLNFQLSVSKMKKHLEHFK